MFSAPVTDSVSDGVAAGDGGAGDAGGAGEEEYPAAVFPPYDGRQLRALRERLRAAGGGAPASALALSAVPEPGLYALAAALAGEAGESDGRGELAARLRAELRTRNCRGMGVDPVGAVRRGRLLQLIGSFTTLRVAGVSSLQRRRMRGDCPLCGGADALRVSLALARWQCFACGRSGGLLEFAEELLAKGAG